MLSWREVQKNNFFSLDSLVDFLELDANHQKQLSYSQKFILNLPYRLAKKIKKNDLTDPLLRQFVPLQDEHIKTAGFLEDPVGDRAACQTSRLIHKYEGRVLLTVTSACAMHCRYCFRQNFPYEKESGFEKEIEWIKNTPSISEVILSGGDPLSLSDEKLEGLFDQLEVISHIERVRIHSRFLIGIPERVSHQFLQLFENRRFQCFFVLHCNHPKELDEDVKGALYLLKEMGIPLLNQSVLLKGVNDQLDTLIKLSKELINSGVIPYYLHQLDPVQGSAHFFVAKDTGKSLIEAMRKNLPGYAVPRYAEEIAKEPSKSIIL